MVRLSGKNKSPEIKKITNENLNVFIRKYALIRTDIYINKHLVPRI